LPVLPWIKKEPNDWLPEKFGLRVGSKYVVLKTDDIAPLRERIKEARESGKEFVEFGDEKPEFPPQSKPSNRSLNCWGQ
jgi:hypothetical protein